MMCSFLLACSGPNAGAVIRGNELYAWECAVPFVCRFIASLLLAVWKTKLPAVVWLFGGMLLLHPAWTISARRGDCGFFKAEASVGFLIAAIVITLCHFAYACSEQGPRAPIASADAKPGA